MSLDADPPPHDPPAATGRGVAYAAALALTAAAALAAVLVDTLVQVPNLSLIFVLPVVIAAVAFGWGPAFASALLGVAAFNFLLVEPRYSFRVAEPTNLWALALLLLVAAIVSTLAAQSRRRAIVALEAADQALALRALSRQLLAATDRPAIAQAGADALSRLFKAPAVVLAGTDDGLALEAASAGADLLDPDLEAAGWAVASRTPTRAQVYPVEAATFDFWPVLTPARKPLAIGVRLTGRAEGRPSAPERLVEVVGGYLAVAFDRQDYAGQVLESRVAMEGQRLKADLLAAVSHDLKTPLSTILVTLQSLRKFAHDAADRDDLLALAERETARLNGLVANLLDMSRLDADAVVVHARPTPMAELLEGAVARSGAALDGRRLKRPRAPAGAPLMADPALAESALANILENAAKYSPAGSPIELRHGQDEGSAWVEVLDEGPGFAGAAERLFEKFARGVEGDGRPPGTGLGLAIARGFIEAQGGRVEAADRTDRTGAVVRLVLPLAPA